MNTTTNLLLGFILILFSSSSWGQDQELDDLEQSLESTSSNEASVTVMGLRKKTERLQEDSALTPKATASKIITLRGIIEEGLRRNYDQRIRKFTRARFELDFKDAYEDFWFPNLNLTFTTDDHLIEKLYTDNSLGNGTSKTPNGVLGLEFEEYTVFNWGRDYLQYINNKETFERNKQRLGEARRHLRFDLISQYFTLVRAHQISEVARNRLRQASFIYRLNREKLGLRKINQEEFLLAKQDFLASQTDYQQSLAQIAEEDARLADLMGDDPMTAYRPLEVLKYEPVTTKQDDAYKISIKNSPNLLDKKLFLENSARSYKKILKDQLPLPELNVRLGAFRHGFGEDGTYDTYQTGPNNKNVELTASVNMTWRIFGSGGLLNQRDTKRAYLDKRISEMEFLDTKRNLSVEMRSLYQQIRQYEQKVRTNTLMTTAARDAYDRSLDNYIASKTTYPQVRLALDNFVSSRIEEENAKLFHLIFKLRLARLMGVDDLPGENFETLGAR